MTPKMWLVFAQKPAELSPSYGALIII